MLTGIDADINENDSFDVDRLRIKIWYNDTDNNESVVYDNGVGADDDDDNATTEISGGSINTHDPKWEGGIEISYWLTTSQNIHNKASKETVTII